MVVVVVVPGFGVSRTIVKDDCGTYDSEFFHRPDLRSSLLHWDFFILQQGTVVVGKKRGSLMRVSALQLAAGRHRPRRPVPTRTSQWVHVKMTRTGRA